jgi:hypothetical protein
VKTLLDHDQVVRFQGGTYTVVGKRWYQSRHFREDAFMVSYHLEPIDYAGLEHDEEIWVSEPDIKGVMNGLDYHA